MNGKSLLQMVHEQKAADEFAHDSDTIVPAIFVAALLFIVVFLVCAALDIAWVHPQQWYQVIASYWPF
ncbi:hypothetical protein SAMN05216358_0533 [Rhizobium sp. AN5]|uniref:hypothetical protein n=1 Tax=Rhizobium sp. AN5 TaxID=1855304 RepID=UPI000BDC717D|nr:hypothetical protein [Rhizobium sp. AN5]SOC90465.1 hypothetical protein SAMN05216358_0533 [Rhizobium sp. AN5]